MDKVSQITKYVKSVFSLYDMDKFEFFYDYDDDTLEEVEISLFPSGKIDEETIRRIGTTLGLTSSEILSMDVNAARRFWRKYEFFPLYYEFYKQWRWDVRFAEKRPTEEEMLVKVIFSDEDDIYSDYKRRYDFQDVKSRLHKTLEKIDKVMPGTIHEGAEITKLGIRTETLISFPQCDRMVRSLLDMVKRLEELFFKAIKTELDEGEINEINFLASWLEASDVVMPSTRVTYDNILIYKNVYAEENLDDFFEYVKLHRLRSFYPWRCKEFFDDLDLVQQYVNVYPWAKSEIREFAVNLEKFTCEFVWSDAKPIMFSEEEERELSEFNAAIGEEDIPLSERAKEVTVVYVDKTPEEMGGCEEYIRRISDVASTSNKGGLKVPIRKSMTSSSVERFSRLRKRIDARNKGGES